MRKIVTILLCLFLVLSICACGDSAISPPDSKDSATNSSNETVENKNPVADITMSDVMSHPESPASDFLCNDDGNGGLIINEYLGNSDIVVIPEKIDGKAVTKINTFVFANDSSVKGIKLSSTIKEIDEGAFANNINLQYVICGNDLVVIGRSSFLNCSSLCDIKLNDGLKKICQTSFANCGSLKNIDVPVSVETIEYSAFHMMSEDFTIIGAAGSPAETFANDSSINFEAK